MRTSAANFLERVPAPAGGALSFRRKCPKPFPRSAGRGACDYPVRFLRYGVALTAPPCAGRASSPSWLRPWRARLAQSSARLALRVMKTRHLHTTHLGHRRPRGFRRVRSARREEPARQVGARERPDRAIGTGRCRERGPEDASCEGTRLKPYGRSIRFQPARNPRGDFLWVLSLFAQGKYLVIGARKPHLN